MEGATYDGNTLAGPLADVFAVEVTTAVSSCRGCGQSTVVADPRGLRARSRTGRPLPRLCRRDVAPGAYAGVRLARPQRDVLTARAARTRSGDGLMRRIGLLGGMSWESSSEYYTLVNRLVRERLGGLHSADCLMYSVDFAPIAELQSAGRWEDAGNAAGRSAPRCWRRAARTSFSCAPTPCTSWPTRCRPRSPSRSST